MLIFQKRMLKMLSNQKRLRILTSDESHCFRGNIQLCELAERERKNPHARIEKLNLELSISDWLRLSNQLIHPLFGNRADAFILRCTSNDRWIYSSAGVRGTDCLTARIGMSHLRLGERKNPNPASLRDKRYRPLQRHQQPIRKPNQKIYVDACPQEPRREPRVSPVLVYHVGNRA